MSLSRRTAFAWAVCLVTLATTASAQRGNPGSLLLFPQFDARGTEGQLNLITVTNSEVDPSGVPVDTVWDYVNGWNCTSDAVTETLNVADTLTVFANFHAPVPTYGYLFVYATDPVTGQASVHDHLIGTSTIFDGVGALTYTAEPLSFQGIGDGQYTDLDADGARDLDGLEYSQVADQLILPRFIGQSSELNSALILIDLSGGPGFTTTIDFLVSNDNEEVFSLEYSFSCWARVSLLNISGIFNHDFLAQFTNHDPNEVFGAPQIESGWVWLDGDTAESVTVTIDDPAFACLLFDYRPMTETITSIHPIGWGKQGNGSLMPNGNAAASK